MKTLSFLLCCSCIALFAACGESKKEYKIRPIDEELEMPTKNMEIIFDEDEPTFYDSEEL